MPASVPSMQYVWKGYSWTGKVATYRAMRCVLGDPFSSFRGASQIAGPEGLRPDPSLVRRPFRAWLDVDA